MTALSFNATIEDLESRGVFPDRPPGIEALRSALDQVGLSERRIASAMGGDLRKVILVAGTNGKGSICATLETLLLDAGQSVGLFTSPHLICHTERIRIDGKDISESLFSSVYWDLKRRTQTLGLSHFEMLTLMAAWIFFSEQNNPSVNYAIFEVGLGGKWDATNAIPHQTAIIGSIGKDHEKFLGHTLVEIASNKFGIVNKGATVIHSQLPDKTHALKEQTQRQTKSNWIQSESLSYKVNLANGNFEQDPEFQIEMRGKTARIELPGKRGAENTATAVTAFSALGFKAEAHLSSLCNIRWPGRMERVTHTRPERRVYLSSDHNPQGVESLIELLQYYPRKKLHILAGVGKEKDLDGILSPLFELPNCDVYLTQTPFRGLSVSLYGRYTQLALYCHDDFKVVWRKMDMEIPRDPAEMILVTGSIYLVGAAQKFIRDSTTQKSSFSAKANDFVKNPTPIPFS